MEADRRAGVAVNFSASIKNALKWAVDNVIRKGDHLILVTIRPEVHYQEGEMQLWEVTDSPFIPLSEFSDHVVMKKYGVKPDPEILDIVSTAARQKEDNKGSYLSESDKGKGYGVQWMDFSRSGSGYGKGYSSRGKAPGVNVAVNDTDRNELTRKSKRVPKRRVLDVGINSDDNDEDEKIRYIVRLNASNGLSNYKDEEDERNGRDGAIFEDRNYVEEDEPISDDEPGSKRKKLGRGSVDLFVEGRTESTPTTRNRALQSGKDLLSGPGSTLVELPDGLPPAPPKKQKEKLSEVEQQLKKAEAAQRCRMQSEKAAREAEAEAIRKILGQDSGRKKREEKMKKQRVELAQGKAAQSETLASNTVRWVIGPDGTTVIFSEQHDELFNSVPCSYPPPREKCAGPNCTNTYKYRDSKSKLPLCSLDCYKAIHAKAQPLIAC